MSGVDLYRFGDLDAWKEDEQDSMNNDKSGKVEYNDKVSQNSDDPLADLAAFSAELGGKMGFWDSHGSKWIDNFGQREGEVCDAEEKWLQDLVDELDVKIEGLDLDHELKKWESWGSLAKFFVPYWHRKFI